VILVRGLKATATIRDRYAVDGEEDGVVVKGEGWKCPCLFRPGAFISGRAREIPAHQRLRRHG